ncbi:MAG: 2-hydroxyacid dehydrogenase [Steroidobacteraceae bacterium]
MNSPAGAGESTSKAPLRIAMLDVARKHAPLLSRLLECPHEFIEPSAQPQPVDAVVALRYGQAEARQFLPRLVHLPGAGADALEASALSPQCTVCNVFEHEAPIAEFVLAAVLDHAIGYCDMVRGFDSEHWGELYSGRRPHAEIGGKILGLVGYGHIGKAVTQRAHAFGMRVHVVSQSGNAAEADWAAGTSRLLDMLRIADFLVIACPLTPDTRGLIGTRELEAMKPSAVIINIGRAHIIEEEPLFYALQNARLAGATLDVWYQYPAAGDAQARPSKFPFDRLPNVHCTPHSCAWTEELFERRYAVIADNLMRLNRGQPLRHVIHGPAIPLGRP